MKSKEESSEQDDGPKNVKGAEDEQSNTVTREGDGGGGSDLEADQASKCGEAEEGEVVFDGDKTARKNCDKVNSEEEGDFEANGGKETGDGGTRKKKSHRKCPKSTTPVSETPCRFPTVCNTVADTVQHVG